MNSHEPDFEGGNIGPSEDELALGEIAQESGPEGIVDDPYAYTEQLTESGQYQTLEAFRPELVDSGYMTEAEYEIAIIRCLTKAIGNLTETVRETEEQESELADMIPDIDIGELSSAEELWGSVTELMTRRRQHARKLTYLNGGERFQKLLDDQRLGKEVFDAKRDT